MQAIKRIAVVQGGKIALEDLPLPDGQTVEVLVSMTPRSVRTG